LIEADKKDRSLSFHLSHIFSIKLINIYLTQESPNINLFHHDKHKPNDTIAALAGALASFRQIQEKSNGRHFFHFLCFEHLATK
jgi:hypothetical protein